MQLLIRGSAFGLPSIDAECVSAVALLRLYQVEKFQLVPIPDDHTRLPCLIDHHEHIHGFNNIIRHLENRHGTRPVDAQQRADSVALSSFLQCNAQPLLDVSLYISFDNYTHTTRPAFTKILPWHTNYLLPPKLRSAAKARTAHLGISSIDVDNVHEDLSNRPEGFDGVGMKDGAGLEAQAQKRASLLLPRRETVRSLLQRPEHAAVFKLQALADNFFGPLQDMLGGKQYLLGDEPANVDCLAYGHLSLMLYPQVAQDWLGKTMRTKYKALLAYTERMHVTFSLQTDVENVMSLTKCKTEDDIIARRQASNMTLLWTPRASSSITDVIARTGRELLTRIPVLGNDTVVIPSKPSKPTLLQQYLPLLLGTTATAVALGIYWSIKTGLLVWPHGEEVHIFGRRRFSDYGHLGAALAGVSMLGQQASRERGLHEQEQRGESPVHVEVAVESGRVP